MKHWLLLVMSCVFVVGCGSTSETKSESVRASSDARRSETLACFGIVNGRYTSDHPSVVLLSVPGGICTGTFIRHNAILTASHCTDASPNGGVSYIPGDSYTHSELARAIYSAIPGVRAYHSGPLANAGTTIASGETDLAIVIFPDQIAPAVSPLLPRPAVSGDEIQLVGFGLSKLTTYGQSDNSQSVRKREGRNQAIIYPGEEGIYMRGAADTLAGCNASDSLAASGDSGGPVFIGGQVAGVMSGSDRGTRESPRAASVGEAYAVDLQAPRSRTFIESVKKAEQWD